MNGVEYPVVVVVKTDGSRLWAHAYQEGPYYFQVFVPLAKGDRQFISIPWGRIDQIETAEEDDAPWNQSEPT